MTTATLERLIDALGLPPQARIDQRIPKKLLLEQGAPTSTDKRLIQDGIEELIWVAALKPTSIGVPIFKDEEREYLEIAVLTAELRAGIKAARLLELLHRAIPYPVLLLVKEADSQTVMLSLAHKRFAQNEAGKTVVESIHGTLIDLSATTAPAFQQAIALSALPRQDMFALYEGWLTCLVAWEASCLTGTFLLPDSAANSRLIHSALNSIAELTKELSSLRASASKEKQINRRVELNLHIKRLESEINNFKERLSAA